MKKMQLKKSDELKYEIQMVICNSCAKEIKTGSDFVEMNKMHSLTFHGGYGSVYPGDLTSAHLDVCEECLVKWISTFRIAPEISDSI